MWSLTPSRRGHVKKMKNFKMKIANWKVVIVAAAVMAIAAVVLAGPPITEFSAIKFTWEHTEKTPVRVFANGVFWREISTNEIALVSVNATNGVSTWNAVALLPKGGQEYRFTATAVDLNGVESEPSNTFTQYVRIKGPGNFGGKEK